MADTLRSIVEGMEHRYIWCAIEHSDGAENERMHEDPCIKCRLLALLDAAEKTDLVQLVNQHEKYSVLGGNGLLVVTCNCGHQFTSRISEEPDAHTKWAKHCADELRDWLVARDKETGGK